MNMNPTTGVVAVAMGIVGFALFTEIFRMIWNGTMPSVLGVNRMNFWQALGLMVMVTILFSMHGFITNGVPALAKSLTQAEWHVKN